MPVPAGPPVVATSEAGLCSPWVDSTAIAARSDMADVAADAATLDAACLDASSLLYALSGRQFPGVCTATVRPVDYPYGCTHVTALRDGLASGRLTLDSWTAATGGGFCGDGGLDLGLYPIRSAISVKINGQVLDPSTYRVDGERWLVRPDVLFWPTAQRLDLPDSADGTFSVTVQFGADPPAHGVSAAARLAAELAKDRTPGATSGLPRRVTNVTRQGVSVTAIDPMTYMRDGLVGIYEVDAFLTSVNPHRQTAPPLVWSPDLPRRRRTA
jgi:hypothetical protein